MYFPVSFAKYLRTPFFRRKNLAAASVANPGNFPKKM